jgi:hypothetical protein
MPPLDVARGRELVERQTPPGAATRRDGASYAAFLCRAGWTHRTPYAPAPALLGLRRNLPRRGHGSFC